MGPSDPNTSSPAYTACTLPLSHLPTFLNLQEVLVSVVCRKAEPHTGVCNLLHRQVCQRREPVRAFVYRSVLGAVMLLENNLLSELVISG